MGTTIRSIESHDRARVLELAPRLCVGVAPWRSPEAVVSAVTGWVREALDDHDAEHPMFVAVSDGTIIGFVAGSASAHWTGETDAYVGELFVAADQEGRGIGALLLSRFETWARDRGHARIRRRDGSSQRGGQSLLRTPRLPDGRSGDEQVAMRPSPSPRPNLCRANARPGPSSSSSPAARPVDTSSSDSTGPWRSSPSPRDHATSSASETQPPQPPAGEEREPARPRPVGRRTCGVRGRGHPDAQRPGDVVGVHDRVEQRVAPEGRGRQLARSHGAPQVGDDLVRRPAGTVDRGVADHPVEASPGPDHPRHHLGDRRRRRHAQVRADVADGPAVAQRRGRPLVRTEARRGGRRPRRGARRRPASSCPRPPHPPCAIVSLTDQFQE